MTSVGQNNSCSKIVLSLRFSSGSYVCSPVLAVISLPQAGLPYLSYPSIFLCAQGFPLPSPHLISPFLLSSKCFVAMICFFPFIVHFTCMNAKLMFSLVFLIFLPVYPLEVK